MILTDKERAAASRKVHRDAIARAAAACVWLVKFRPIFGGEETRRFPSKEAAETWARMAGYLSDWPGRTRCTIEKEGPKE